MKKMMHNRMDLKKPKRMRKRVSGCSNYHSKRTGQVCLTYISICHCVSPVYASSDDEDNAQLREFRSKQSGPKNSCSAIGVHENLTAVTRDNMVGIFMNESTSDQKLKYGLSCYLFFQFVK